jgi:hypothetical protein
MEYIYYLGKNVYSEGKTGLAGLLRQVWAVMQGNQRSPGLTLSQKHF